ncbi:hypothetical protein N869_05085 [Cellulomonas bogoriensis 69B4 = DSM 16987]|uniref:Uncharacterized protein n=1 Tax=Cellulomonas bogoriensis 69B4 = DSM 16987 TaxID=1386082 RepID=A0A0A0C331_9CELL|nr:hypothetical protein N869_05085 [Cellulomonas bogoriensis 69B4 = DSM 16987]
MVVAVALATACTADAPDAPVEQEGQGFVEGEGYIAEYEQAAEALEWPGGVEPPGPSPDAGTSYQVGVGESQATMEWNCAWGREWLSLREQGGDEADHALEMYAGFLETRTFREMFDPESAQPVVRQIVEDARLGDPSGVQRDVETNCPTDGR